MENNPINVDRANLTIMGVSFPDLESLDSVAKFLGLDTGEEAAKGGHPAELSPWSLAYARGLPAAHEAAERGTLPSDFGDWEIRDKLGRTVAHVAVQWGLLPPSFNLWTMRDRCGFNVAETASVYGNLPAGISDWRDLIEGAATPRDLVPPIPLWPALKSSISPSLLPTMFGISISAAKDDDFYILLGNFLDAFYLSGSETRSVMLREEPKDMAERWRAPYLGATAAVLARRFDLKAPDWASHPRCFLPADSPYFPYRLKGRRETKAPASAPPEFIERNVFVSASALYRA
ncbi:MAG: hypothetical protein LBO66_08635 [Deltaproteobacteria bacterium]|nr:hypothetical protein [Deltaproteobacteria bacterium]